MKRNFKISIIVLSILLALSLIFNTNSILGIYGMRLGERDDITFDNDYLNRSEFSERIHINNNWTEAWEAGICTGNGIYSDPYIIEDLVIDGGGQGYCILIENSNVYFKIENCTVYNSGLSFGFAGIKLSNTTNGQLIENNCSTNNLNGIRLDDSYNNNITRNILNNNYNGIYLIDSDNNNLSGNTASNIDFGIYLLRSHNNTISGNTADGHWVGIQINVSNDNDISGNNATSNSDGISMTASDNNMISGNLFNNNGGGMYLVACYRNVILGNNISNNVDGVGLRDSNYNDILDNIINDNDYVGIILRESNYNTVSGNILIGNQECILEFNCEGNKFSDNTGCDYGETKSEITGFMIPLLLAILSLGVIIISIRIKRN